MKLNSSRIILSILLLTSVRLSAQNTSPYWSLAGNNNATATHKFGTTNAINLRFVTNNTDRLTITAGGNIGIGSTNPTEKLHVNSAAALNPLRLQVNGVTTLLAHANGGLSIGSASTPSPNGLYIAGRVGIGTASPHALLRLPSSGKLTLTTTDNFLLGTLNSNNLAFDHNKIQARTNGLGNSLQLNPFGGAVALGKIVGTTNPGIYVSGDGAAAMGGQYTQPGYSLTVNPNFGGGIYLYQPSGKTNFLLRAENSGNSTALSVSNLSAGNYWPAITATTAGSKETILGINKGGTTESSAVKGSHEGSGYGVHGSSAYGLGVFAYSENGFGIYATTGSNTYSAHFSRNVYVNGSVFTGSDQKLKQNVQDLKGAMLLISKLQPKTYNYRQDGAYQLMRLPEGTRYGLIAQDLEKVLPELVKEAKFESAWETGARASDGVGSRPTNVRNEVTNFKAVSYTELIPIMIKGMQEQQQQIDELKALVEKLTREKNNNNSRPVTTVNGKAVNGKMVVLSQNSPNPANTVTRISYVIGSPGRAQLMLSDASGRTVNLVTLGQSGTVEIPTSALQKGSYFYSLLLDGQVLQTKKMEVIR